MRVLFLLLIAACADPEAGTATGEAPDTAPTGADGADGADGGDGADGTAARDADGDGHAADTDCDDADPTIHPEAAEVCDGVDQDCDGAIDEGVPSDGAGCQDPGAPGFPDTVGVVHVTAVTGSSTFNGTDDSVRACLGADRCLSLNKPDWDDMEPGHTDVQVVEGVGWSRDDLTGLSVTIDPGTDQWRPSCFSVRLDGEPMGCWSVDVPIGSEGSEVTTWDSDGWGGDCETCFSAPLTHGPAVGAVSAFGATIWLRADATRAVRLRVADRADALVDAAPVAHRYPSADTDFTEHVAVVGLQPGTTYHYDLELDGARFGPWSFTTAPAPGAATRATLAMGSCSKTDEQPLFGVIAAQDPDLFLFLGDNHYGNTDDLAAHRQHYRTMRGLPLRGDLLAGRAMLATWDDHDFTGNNTDGTEPGKDVALRAFEEFQPNGSAGTAEVAGVFSRHTWGDIDLFLLDDRYWRGLDDSILGDGQEAWLLDGLAASTATFKLVASGSQFTLDGSGDSWAAFPEAQTRLRQALVDREIEGVVLLSGDIHRSELRLLEGAPGGYDLPELTSSPLANSNSTCRSTSPELRACYDDGVSFVRIDIDTTLADPTLTARIIDEAAGTRAEWVIARSQLTLP